MPNSRQPTFFITATDTNAGKTWVTQHFIRALRAQHVSAIALKPVACGVNAQGINDDVAQLAQAQQCALEHINLYTFQQPSAPLQAALSEGKKLSPTRLNQWCQRQCHAYHVRFIEGIGGLMVPLAEQYLVRDWIHDTPSSRVILVVGAKLGCINQTLLTLEAFKDQHPDYIILNDTHGNQDLRSLQSLIQPYAPASRIILSPYAQPQVLASLASTLAQPNL